MVYYTPVKIEYTKEQIKQRLDFAKKYTNNKKFRKLVDSITEKVKK